MFCAFDVNVEESLPAYLRVCVHGALVFVYKYICVWVCKMLNTGILCSHFAARNTTRFTSQSLSMALHS